MTKALLLLLSIITVPIFVLSQDSSRSTTPAKDSILFVKGLRYSVGGTIVKKDKLGSYFQSNQVAIKEYAAYLKKNRQSTPFGLIMLGSFIGGLTQIGSHNKVALGLGITSLVSGFIGFKIFQKGCPHFNNAVCMYNANL